MRRTKMTGWYDPPRLTATAIRVAISTVFGEFADRREAMASTRESDPKKLDPAYDYGASESESGLWFDFVADTGDGWNSTYAVARLLADPKLGVAGCDESLELADLLIMGGDQVYPTASREAYKTKLVAPYEEAARGQSWAQPPSRDLYALPGNHDWYDGLNSFVGLFCRRRLGGAWATMRPGRDFGGRRTQQTRSYFALRLPDGWWLWGADVQLKGYIDQPQIDFFTHVANDWMDENSKLILCTGMPSWAYVNTDNPKPDFKNFSYLERIATLAGKGHRLRVVLSGDSHHYSRYEEGDCQYITAGGGGAFLHPTHHLRKLISFKWRYPPPGVSTSPAIKNYQRQFELASDRVTKELRLFPDPSTSRRLTWLNLAFAALNWQYTVTLSLACSFYAWLLHANADPSLATVLAPPVLPSFAETLYAYFRLVFASPLPVVFSLMAFGGYYYLADFRAFWPRILLGALHASTQFALVVLASCLIARWTQGTSSGSLIVYIGVVGGLISSTALGIYFIVCLNLLGLHWNEAFSSLRLEGWKCFLRMHIALGGKLTIYPIGLTKVPRDDDADHPPRNPPLAAHMIEPPVVTS